MPDLKILILGTSFFGRFYLEIWRKTSELRMLTVSFGNLYDFWARATSYETFQYFSHRPIRRIGYKHAKWWGPIDAESAHAKKAWCARPRQTNDKCAHENAWTSLGTRANFDFGDTILLKMFDGWHALRNHMYFNTKTRHLESSVCRIILKERNRKRAKH